MNPLAPPSWMERLLQLLLPLRSRQTVVGDLLEEFREQKVLQLGYWRASFWYLRETLSFAPPRIRSAFVQRPALILVCAFTALCGCWLGIMDLLLRHSGYAGQAAIAGTIVCQALLTLVALRFGRYAMLRYLSLLGCLAMFWFAGEALLGIVRGAEFEGYVAVIAIALIIQSLLTVFTLLRVDNKPGGAHDHL